MITANIHLNNKSGIYYANIRWHGRVIIKTSGYISQKSSYPMDPTPEITKKISIEVFKKLHRNIPDQDLEYYLNNMKVKVMYSEGWAV